MRMESTLSYSCCYFLCPHKFRLQLIVLNITNLIVQIRTHSIRKANENIDRTVKAAEVILAQFDVYHQVHVTRCSTV